MVVEKKKSHPPKRTRLLTSDKHSFLSLIREERGEITSGYGNDIYFSYTYDYGNGDSYTGYGYGDSSLGYYSGQYLTGYYNETYNLAFYYT